MSTNFTAREHTIATGFGEWTYSSAGGDTGKRTWYLDADADVTATDADAAYAAGLFKVGDPLSTGDTTRFCTKVTIKAIAGDRRGLYAEAEFGPNQFQANPLLRKDRVSLEVAGETQDWFIDAKTNKPVVNSAGEIFDKLPPRTTGGVKLIIEGNRSTLPASAMVGLSRPHCTNSNAVTVRGLSIGADTAKLTGCSGSPQTENGVDFYTVRWELTLAETWDVKLDDRGFNEKSTASGGTGGSGGSGGASKLKPIVVAGVQTQLPYPLDGSGAKKANPSDVPASLTFSPYKSQSFSFGWSA